MDDQCDLDKYINDTYYFIELSNLDNEYSVESIISTQSNDPQLNDPQSNDPRSPKHSLSKEFVDPASKSNKINFFIKDKILPKIKQLQNKQEKIRTSLKLIKNR